MKRGAEAPPLLSIGDGNAHPTIRHDDGTHDVTRSRRGKERNNLCKFARFGSPFDRRIRPMLAKKFFAVFMDMAQDIGNHIPGANGVDTDAVINRFKG